MENGGESVSSTQRTSTNTTNLTDRQRRMVASLRDLAETELTEAARLLAYLCPRRMYAREREQAGPVDPFLPPNRPSTPLHHLPLEDRLQQADLPQEEELQRQRRRVSLARLQRVIAEEMYWMERVVTAEMTEDREEILRLVEVAHVSAERLLVEVRVLNQVV